MKISVIIGYNKDRGYLKQAIKSVEDQVVDAEVELILSKSDNNIAYNLNRGIERSTGDYIKYLSEDDTLAPGCLSASLKAIDGYDFIHGICMDVEPDGNAFFYDPPIQFPTLEDMLNLNICHGGSLFFRKDVFGRFGMFDESLDCAEEYSYNMHLLKSGAKIGFCESVLYFYRRWDQQKSLGSHVNQVERQKKIEAIRNRYR